MTQEKRFCTNCGTPLGPGDKFCGSCGRPLSPAAAETPPAPAQSAPAPAAPVPPAPPVSPAQPPPGSERLVGIIPAISRKKGLFAVEGFNLLVTEKRLIFAAMTNEMIKEAAKEAGQGGFLSGMIGAMTAGYTYHKKYLNMAPEAALKENPQNFFVDLGRVRKVKVLEGRRLNRGTGVPQYDTSYLEIETVGDKLKFILPHDFIGRAGEVIRQAGLQ